MKSITRTTEVISVSLPKATVRKLEMLRKERGQSKSAAIRSIIDKAAEEERWQRLYRKGEETARTFKITSEDDIDRILHDRRT